jgi:hypothetical protein
MRIRHFLIPCLLLSACVKQHQMIWANPQPAKHNFDEERYTCLREANEAVPSQAAPGRNIFGDPVTYDLNSGNRDEMFSACMKTYGWEQKLVPLKPVASTSANSD